MSLVALSTPYDRLSGSAPTANPQRSLPVAQSILERQAIAPQEQGKTYETAFKGWIFATFGLAIVSVLAAPLLTGPLASIYLLWLLVLGAGGYIAYKQQQTQQSSLAALQVMGKLGELMKHPTLRLEVIAAAERIRNALRGKEGLELREEIRSQAAQLSLQAKYNPVRKILNLDF